jgi:exopolysaccharide biosynthesis polyprenyl glycosylphosphotransferase
VHRKAGLYRPRLAPAVLDDVPAVALGAVISWGLAAAALAATAPRDALGWSELASAAALSAFAVIAGRALVHRLDRHRSRRDPAATLVVGAADAAQQIAAALRAHPEYGLLPVGVAAAPPLRPGPGDDALPFLSTHADIAGAVSRNSVRHAVIVGPPAGPLAELLAMQGCRVWRTGGAEPPHLWGHGYAPFEGVPHARNRHGKRAIDVVLAASALLGLAPVLGACALAVRVADGPGVLFRQERIGLGGRPFTVLKFRTLRPRDAHESATRWSVAHDHRMSAVGRVLRRTSLDELPQLWNVLRGDMSLVGPRPERPYFVEQFSTAHPGYQDRHRMPAGITGLAQVHGLRGDTSIADRARFDNHYIDTWSLWQDVAILLRTARSLFRSGGS